MLLFVVNVAIGCYCLMPMVVIVAAQCVYSEHLLWHLMNLKIIRQLYFTIINPHGHINGNMYLLLNYIKLRDCFVPNHEM